MSEGDSPQSSVGTKTVVLWSAGTPKGRSGTMESTTPSRSGGGTMIGSQMSSPALSPSAPEFVPDAALHIRRRGESRDDHHRDVSQSSYSRLLNTYSLRSGIGSSHFVHHRLCCISYPYYGVKFFRLRRYIP